MDYSDEGDNTPASFYISFMWFMAILIMLMNIPVFVVTPRMKYSSEATKITMISLSITDFLMGALCACRLSYFASVGEYTFAEDYLCLTDGLAQCTLSSISIGLIMFLCIDRVITIKYPLHYPIYFTRKFVISVNIGLWLLVTTTLILGYFVLGMEMTFVKYAYACALSTNYQSKMTLIAVILCFAIPVCVILVCAVMMHHIVRQQITQIRDLENAGATSQMGSLVSHKKSIKTIFCMVGGYYICWSPFMVLVLIWSYIYGQPLSPSVEAVAAWMAVSNSMFNSLVYLPTMKEYRGIFKNIFVPKVFLSDGSQNG